MDAPTTPTYIVCTARGAGGDELAAALGATGAVAPPRVFERGDGVAHCLVETGEPGLVLLADQVAELCGGLGMTWAGLHTLLSRYRPGVRYVWLRRRNLVAQAIDGYRMQAGDAASFDVDAIAERVRRAGQEDRGWHDFFLARKLSALVVVAEEFARQRQTTIQGILHFLGLDAAIPAVAAPAGPDPIALDWERRFRSLRGAEPRYTPRRAPPRRRVAVDGPLPLIAYDVGAVAMLPLDAAAPERPWMDASPGRFAYRCLPMVIANQAGWVVRNPHRLSVSWDGRPDPAGLTITPEAGAAITYASSHFGSGVLTFSLGCLFRTPPGHNLYVRGPANWPKDGICALDGIVETDWTKATFTMNWKLTRAGHPVTFERDEPIACLLPYPRGYLERWQPEVRRLEAEPEWSAGFAAWSRLRTRFNAGLQSRQPGAVAAGWQRHYQMGMDVGDQPAAEHQTALRLPKFKDRRTQDE